MRMSQRVAEQMRRIESNVMSAFRRCEDKGATIPATPNSDNLPDTIDSIPQSGEDLRNFNFDEYMNDRLIHMSTTATKIRDFQFQEMSLQTAEIPNAINIGQYAFSTCSNLTHVTLSPDLKGIGKSAFEGCSNLDIDELPDDVDFGEFAFSYCRNLSLSKLPSRLRVIANFVFAGCSSLKITSLPKRIQVIGTNAFEGCTGIPYLDMSEVLQVPYLEDSDPFADTEFPFLFDDQIQLDEYLADSKWSKYSSRFYIQSEYLGN